MDGMETQYPLDLSPIEFKPEPIEFYPEALEFHLEPIEFEPMALARA
jgi:hypothetical protein